MGWLRSEVDESDFAPREHVPDEITFDRLGREWWKDVGGKI